MENKINAHWCQVRSEPFDRTGGYLNLKAMHGLYQITIENYITDYYEILLTTTKTTVARHCYETIFHAIADDEFLAEDSVSGQRDHISAIASELSVSLK